MLIASQRFGQLEVPDDKIINMERPVLGFEDLRRFCLIETDDLAPFMWFQSIDDARVAFLIVNPCVFFPDYRVEINSQEIAELDVTAAGRVETYVILTVVQEGRDITANLQGPVLVNADNGKAKQLVLVNSQYKVRHSITEALERISESTPVDVVEGDPVPA